MNHILAISSYGLRQGLVPQATSTQSLLLNYGMGYGTKAHGIRHNWLSGIRHTLRLDLGTIHLGWMELGTNFSQGVDMKI